MWEFDLEVVMSKYFLTGLAVLLMAGVAVADGDISRRFEMKPGQTLEVDLRSGGGIEVAGWDKEEIQIDIFLDRSSERYCDFEFDERSSGLRIISDCRRHHGSTNIDVEIRLPRKCQLELETAGGGIRVENIEGEIQGHSAGGGLHLEDIKGTAFMNTAGGGITCRRVQAEVELTTAGGGIVCRDSHLDGYVKTAGGGIEFMNVGGSVRAKTAGGSIQYTYDERRSDNEAGKIEDEIRLTTMGGSIDVDYAPHGASVETNGGSIEINRAAGYVKAGTLGGNIYINEIDGWVKASTNGGDIEVTVTGAPDDGEHNVDISSLGGDIELTVPKNFSMDVDIALAYTRNSHGGYKIYSDFEITQDESSRWDRSEGTPRKYIYGEGKINGGKNRVRIATINGDIYIKEGR